MQIMDYSNSLLIYNPCLSERFTYICEFLFKDIMGVEPVFTTQIQACDLSDTPVLCCAEMHSATFLYVNPWLHSTSLEEPPSERTTYQGMQVLFPYQGDGDALLPFDLFSFAFFLISRFEEYKHGQEEDKWGRYLAANSYLYQTKQLQKPIVDILALHLKEVLIKHFPHLTFKNRKFKYIPTIDIDSVYLYKGKPFYKMVGGLVKDFAKGKGLERLKVLLGIKQDPFANLSTIEAIHQKYGFDSIYFVLMAHYGGVDKNYACESPRFHRSLKHLNVGLHSSYASNFNLDIRRDEISKLAQVPNANLKVHRQHFLYFKVPLTCQHLLAIDIEHDYTLGYAEEPGFRAGTCTPFAFFDLYKNKPTTLILHPLTFMEVTMVGYKKMEESQMYAAAVALIGEVKKVNGEAVSLFHNASFTNYDQWKSLLFLYEKILREVSETI